jgi:hypothetical protein
MHKECIWSTKNDGSKISENILKIMTISKHTYQQCSYADYSQYVLSLGYDISWPPRLPDLTAPDFFLLGYLK